MNNKRKEYFDNEIFITKIKSELWTDIFENNILVRREHYNNIIWYYKGEMNKEYVYKAVDGQTTTYYEGEKDCEQFIYFDKNNKRTFINMKSVPIFKDEQPTRPFNNSSCVICLENQATHLLNVCGHLCLCSSCSNNIHIDKQNNIIDCPLCKTKGSIIKLNPT